MRHTSGRRALAPVSGSPLEVLEHRPARVALFMLVALSGAAGLIYEIVWMREFTLVLGASTYAVTIVLAVFMGGLGLGAWLLGKRADRYSARQLLRLYVMLEIGLALYALGFPLLILAGQSIYVWVYQAWQPGLLIANALRFVLASAVLVVPAVLMGGTLPVLTRVLVRAESRVSLTVSWLYGMNTLGAFAGTLSAGYALVPYLGMRRATLAAAAANLLVAAGVWMLCRARSSSTRPEQTAGAVATPSGTEARPGLVEQAVILVLAISGFASMLYEVAWTRTLTLIVGTTTYSFTTMLATFLLGIGLGSLLFPWLRRRTGAVQLLAALQYTAALSALATIPLLERLPLVYLSLQSAASTAWLGTQLVRFSLAAMVMLLPTIALGATFPAVIAVLVGNVDTSGRRFGMAYGLNTLGSVLGAALGGLLFVPLIGLQVTIVLGAILNFVAGSLAAAVSVNQPAWRRLAIAASGTMAMLLALLFLRPWSPWIMSSGVYVYADRYQQVARRAEAALGDQAPRRWELWRMAMEQYKLLYYRHGPTATVAVMERRDGVRFLSIDGKTDASSATTHDMKTQVMLAQLPLLFHPRPDRVFVVGLGSGVTAGSALTHPLGSLECAELSTAVIEASHYFGEFNHRPLNDPRLTLMRRDARNALLTSRQRYDVVISQPSNPWIGGQSSLFSLQWYQLVRDRLNRGGVFSQWLPAYHMSPRDLRILLNTLRRVFPHVTVWTSGAKGDVILLACKDRPLKIDLASFHRKLASAAVREDIARLGLNPHAVPLRCFVMSERELQDFLQQRDARRELNTDDLLLTEFSTPEQLARAEVVKHFTAPASPQRCLQSLLPLLTGLDAGAVDEILAAHAPVSLPAL